MKQDLLQKLLAVLLLARVANQVIMVFKFIEIRLLLHYCITVVVTIITVMGYRWFWSLVEEVFRSLSKTFCDLKILYYK